MKESYEEGSVYRIVSPKTKRFGKLDRTRESAMSVTCETSKNVIENSVGSNSFPQNFANLLNVIYNVANVPITKIVLYHEFEEYILLEVKSQTENTIYQH